MIHSLFGIDTVPDWSVADVRKKLDGSRKIMVYLQGGKTASSAGGLSLHTRRFTHTTKPYTEIIDDQINGLLAPIPHGTLKT